jgi:hypothetical protein
MSTGDYVRRSNITVMKMNEVITDTMNAITDEDTSEEIPLFDEQEGMEVVSSIYNDGIALESKNSTGQEDPKISVDDVSDRESVDTVDSDPADEKVADEDASEEEDDVPPDLESEEDSDEEDVSEESSVSKDLKGNRTKRNRKPANLDWKFCYEKSGTANVVRQYECFHTSVKRGLQEYGKDALNAIEAELRQMLRDKKALIPVKKNELSAAQLKKVIRSFMFLKTKFDGMGRFEKIKARLVANGKQQDRSLYPNVYSPTVQLVSVFMGLIIAARENRKIAVVDIGGAYLNAERTNKAGEEIIMEVEPLLVSILARIAPEIIPFVDSVTGKLYVKLDKALYGTLDAAKLWYEKLSSVLKANGFKENEVDPCVFNKMINGYQCTVMLYVDDLLILAATSAVIMEIIDMLKRQFDDDVKFSMEEHMSYLGMHLHIERGRIIVSMESYIDSLLQDCGIGSSVTSPATGKLFKASVASKPLVTQDAKVFHTTVARLLYLAKRVRADILLAVAYLTTRVKAPTEEDKGKLERVLKYLYGTKDQVLVLSPKGSLVVEGYIDAAFGCHEDGKSHTGVVITLGKTFVAAMSSKQKIVSKDSTEAELAGLSDKVLSVVKCSEFMRSQGYSAGSTKVYQDNTSCIQLITGSGGIFRNKYFNVRRARVRELCDSGELEVVYLETRQMLADILTKPLQGALFSYLLCLIIGKSL